MSDVSGPGNQALSWDPEELRRTADLLGRLAQDTLRPDSSVSLDLLVTEAVALLPTASWASITTLRDGEFATVASNSTVAVEADLLQYRHGTGPCVDAVLQDGIFVTPDVSREPRWQPLGERLHDDLGITSMLALRLHPLDESETIAGLNFSSAGTDAFSQADVHRARILATQCALIITADLAKDKVKNLVAALESNREIGVAIGVLMARHNLTSDQAFDVLRHTSQNSNRKLRDLAAEVALTGVNPADHHSSAP